MLFFINGKGIQEQGLLISAEHSYARERLNPGLFGKFKLTDFFPKQVDIF